MTLANSVIQIFISEFKPIMHAEPTWPPLAGLGLGDEKGKMPVIRYRGKCWTNRDFYRLIPIKTVLFLAFHANQMYKGKVNSYI